MKPARIILIRHAESEGNIDKVVYGHTPDYARALSSLGEQQVEAASQRLRTLIGDETVVVCISPLWRTQRSFEHLVAAEKW